MIVHARIAWPVVEGVPWCFVQCKTFDLHAYLLCNLYGLFTLLHFFCYTFFGRNFPSPARKPDRNEILHAIWYPMKGKSKVAISVNSYIGLHCSATRRSLFRCVNSVITVYYWRQLNMFIICMCVCGGVTRSTLPLTLDLTELNR